MLKLHTDKIEKERVRNSLSKAELARRMGISRQLLNHTIKHKQLFHVDKFAEVFDMDAKDLIK
jgi:transcriptional regulator with XRE-family HTH domain